MRVVVTGGTGFLGSPLTRRLVQEGHDVVTYSRREDPLLEGAAHVRGDVCGTERLRAVLAGADIVFHLAWTSLPQTSNENPLADVQTNVDPGVAVLDACRLGRVGMVVFPSSGGTVYGSRAEEFLTETSETEPICSYGITKLMFEKYLALYRHLYGLDYRVLRVSNAYGPGQPSDRPQGLIAVTMARTLADEGLTVWGDGSATRDYVYVDDVIEGFMAALRPLPENASRTFNIASREGHTILEVLAEIEQVSGRRPDIIYAPPRDCDAQRVVLCNRRAEEELGWRPTVSLTEGVQQTWDSMRDFSLATEPS
jgi:UDP-glucose 4-epimerase